MKKIYIPFIDSIAVDAKVEDISILMDSLTVHKIDNEPWPEFKSNCNATFSIAHTGNSILLKYYVNEDVLKASVHKTNGPVYKDNCVEFFISFEPEKGYYNLEVNCFGVCLVGYGYGRENRKLLPEDAINKIKKFISIRSAAFPGSTIFQWQVTLVIPIELFEFDDLNTFARKHGRGNFYKCGDDLPHPHFLTWNMIQSKSPDFHLPGFFGEVEFG